MRECSPCSTTSPAWVSLEFFILAILTGIRWNLKDLLICILLMSNDDKHFIKCPQSLEILLLSTLCLDLYPNFLIGLFDMLLSTFTICRCMIVHISDPPKFYTFMKLGHQRNLQRDVILQVEKDTGKYEHKEFY